MGAGFSAALRCCACKLVVALLGQRRVQRCLSTNGFVFCAIDLERCGTRRQPERKKNRAEAVAMVSGHSRHTESAISLRAPHRSHRPDYCKAQFFLPVAGVHQERKNGGIKADHLLGILQGRLY
jgi:hypothetical protein